MALLADPTAPLGIVLALLGEGMVARELLQARNDKGLTPVAMLALLGRAEWLGAALDVAGAEPPMGDDEGHTPLHYAGSAAVVQLLCARGWAVDAAAAAPREGSTPLITAALQGREETCLALLEMGAEIDREDSTGAAALDWAWRSGHKPLAMALRRKGARTVTERHPTTGRRGGEGRAAEPVSASADAAAAGAAAEAAPGAAAAPEAAAGAAPAEGRAAAPAARGEGRAAEPVSASADAAAAGAAAGAAPGAAAAPQAAV